MENLLGFPMYDSDGEPYETRVDVRYWDALFRENENLPRICVCGSRTAFCIDWNTGQCADCDFPLAHPPSLHWMAANAAFKHPE